MSEQLLTTKEQAARLGVKESTIYSWVRARKIPHIVLNAGRRKACVRFSPAAIEQWLKAREREAKPGKWDLR